METGKRKSMGKSKGPKEKDSGDRGRRKIVMYTLDQMVSKHVAKKGTPEREQFEFELKMTVFGGLIRSARLQKKLTQEQLGALVGVKKAHISKIENGAHNARVDTLVKVFKALDADVRIQVRMKGH
jgi:HTH-type transcriptional regulator/antitoxin HipB